MVFVFVFVFVHAFVLCIINSWVIFNICILYDILSHGDKFVMFGNKLLKKFISSSSTFCTFLFSKYFSFFFFTSNNCEPRFKVVTGLFLILINA